MEQDYIIEPINIETQLHGYENQWVALDRNHRVIASDYTLPSLIEKLPPEQLAQNPTFLQALRHDVSFISACL